MTTLTPNLQAELGRSEPSFNDSVASRVLSANTLPGNKTGPPPKQMPRIQPQATAGQVGTSTNETGTPSSGSSTNTGSGSTTPSPSASAGGLGGLDWTTVAANGWAGEGQYQYAENPTEPGTYFVVGPKGNVFETTYAPSKGSTFKNVAGGFGNAAAFFAPGGAFSAQQTNAANAANTGSTSSTSGTDAVEQALLDELSGMGGGTGATSAVQPYLTDPTLDTANPQPASSGSPILTLIIIGGILVAAGYFIVKYRKNIEDYFHDKGEAAHA